MQTWIPLAPIGVEDWFGPKLKAAAGEFNERIERVLERRRLVDEVAAREAAADVGDLDVDNVVGFPSHRVSVLELLKAELKLRRELAGFWSSYYASLGKAVNDAIASHQRAEKQVEKMLEGLGYSHFRLEPDPCMWQPSMLQRHPRVRAARLRMESLQAKAGDRARERQNVDAIAVLVKELQTAKQRSLVFA